MRNHWENNFRSEGHRHAVDLYERRNGMIERTTLTPDGVTRSLAADIGWEEKSFFRECLEVLFEVVAGVALFVIDKWGYILAFALGMLTAWAQLAILWWFIQ